MAHEVSGVNLADFQDPIYHALTKYSELTDGRVLFGFPERAAKLEFTPNKPYLARSDVPVFHEHQEAGTLCVIAFAPHDATGDDKTFADESEFVSSSFPADPKYYPRNKATAHAEVHLAIVSQAIDSQENPVLFAGHLSLLGLQGSHLREIGYIGQESHSFMSTMMSRRQLRPRATLTTGYSGEMEHPDSPGDRFGDPHALLNCNEGVVQVAGFIAITPEAAPQHLEVLRALHAREPYIGPF